MNKIRIKLKSYYHRLLELSCESIIKAAQRTGAIIVGPIPMPTKKEVFVVLRSPHVNKKSREKFQQRTHTRIIDVYASSASVIDSLMKLDIASGVDVVIKV